jgi:sugar lactone lactonase YvrE
MKIEIINDAGATLGEGPAWDAKNQTLYWVDILEKRVHYHRGDGDGFLQLDEMPGCLAPCKDGTLIVAARASILDLEPATGKIAVLATLDEPANNRFNDGKCDPDGRLLAGTMNMDEESPTGALYSFDGQTVTPLLDGIRISNGLAWSPDYKMFYYIDTPTREVKAFDYDLSTGKISNPRVAISIPEALGWPDGMTSDMDGNLWIAMWGGAQVTHWNPRNGDLLEQISLPAKNVTSCVFGGEGLNELYVTSACKGLDNADLTAYRHSGGLMRVQTRVEGMPTFEFEGKSNDNALQSVFQRHT